MQRDIVNHDKSFERPIPKISRYGMAIGDRLRQAREAKELTQTKLGELIGVGQTTVSQWETGHNNVGIEDIKKVAERTDHDPIWLAFGNQTMAEDEARLLAAYRQLDPARRVAVLTMLGADADDKQRRTRRPFRRRS